MTMGEGSQGSDVPGWNSVVSVNRQREHSEKGLKVWSLPITAQLGCDSSKRRQGAQLGAMEGRTGTRVRGQLPGGLGFSWD